MTSFAELTNQVHLIKDMILTDMIYDNDIAVEALLFSKHLYSTKIWFTRISWANKKRYMLVLIDDLRSAYTISLLLKSIWNCRPKDAVMSVCQPKMWSSFDQVPMDHNRTAQPITLLAQVMSDDRKWFLKLDPESQATVLTELLTISGATIMHDVLNRAKRIYELYRERQLQNIMDCIVLSDKDREAAKAAEVKKEQVPNRRSSSGSQAKEIKPSIAQEKAQKELDIHLANWNSALKSVKDSLKLEEVEMCFKDGKTQKLWKVNRPKPEVTETVDFVQLLPASVGKRIFTYLPQEQLGDYARVNKYWAYLVDDLRAELAIRQKIDLELERLKNIILEHDKNLDQIDYKGNAGSSSSSSMTTSIKSQHKRRVSYGISERSTRYSFRHFVIDHLHRPQQIVQKPIRNLKEITERLERRGAADEHLFEWCNDLLCKLPGKTQVMGNEGILDTANTHFPCPLMKKTVKVPLRRPLFKDPTVRPTLKAKTNVSNITLIPFVKPTKNRYSLWSKDFSKLYHVVKVSTNDLPN